MTVAELMEELSKFPPHHVVVVAHDDSDFSPELGDGDSESSIVDVSGSDRCHVVIDCRSDA